MAIDTAAKRRSAGSFGVIQNINIIPDSLIDQGNRQTIANIYSGILVDAPIVITGDCYESLQGPIVELNALNGIIDDSVVSLQSNIDEHTFLEGKLCC